ncbi:MAG: hypothetical protein E7655_07985 [Ruminococcaceae bacterium]|nr:hypothetical protein [Oscillospiraceae bacterium]
MNNPLRILFIGNSYTYYNDMPSHFEKAAIANGRSVTVESVTKGGWTLEKMADPRDEAGQVVAEKLADGNRYDFVFLQEQSVRPASDPELFYDGVRALAPRIRAVGAKGILYQTWGSKKGHESLTLHGWTPEDMTRLLADSYTYIGKRCDLAVSPVGWAFLDIVQNHPGIDLFHADGKHPSPAGSLLALYCHYATLFSADPLSIDYIGGLASEEEAAILKKAAHDAVYAAKVSD